MGREVSPLEWKGPGTVTIGRPMPTNDHEMPPEWQAKQDEALARISALKQRMRDRAAVRAGQVIITPNIQVIEEGQFD